MRFSCSLSSLYVLLCSALSVDAYYDVDSFDRESKLYYASYLQSPIHDVAYCYGIVLLSSNAEPRIPHPPHHISYLVGCNEGLSSTALLPSAFCRMRIEKGHLD